MFHIFLVGRIVLRSQVEQDYIYHDYLCNYSLMNEHAIWCYSKGSLGLELNLNSTKCTRSSRNFPRL